MNEPFFTEPYFVRPFYLLPLPLEEKWKLVGVSCAIIRISAPTRVFDNYNIFAYCNVIFGVSEPEFVASRSCFCPITN